jgi:hypothetical protein
VLAEKGGKGGGKPGGGDEAPIDGAKCIDSESEFPSFAFTRLVMGGWKGQSVTGYEIHLSNADGDCSILIYEVSADDENYLDISYRQIGSEGVIAWRQYRDESVDSRKDDNAENDLIKVVRFQIANQEIVTDLPLQATTVANSGNRHIAFRSIDLSHDGNTVLLVHADGTSSESTIFTLREIDISQCSSECNQEVLLTAERLDGVIYGADQSRIYYSGESGPDYTAPSYIAFIEYQNGSWSLPRVVTTEDNGFYVGNYNASYSFGNLGYSVYHSGENSPSELLSHYYFDISTGDYEIHVVDVTNCSLSGTGDCVSSGDSDIRSIIPAALYSSLDIKSGHNRILFEDIDSGNIYASDLDSYTESFVIQGHEMDSSE